MEITKERTGLVAGALFIALGLMVQERQPSALITLKTSVRLAQPVATRVNHKRIAIRPSEPPTIFPTIKDPTDITLQPGGTKNYVFTFEGTAAYHGAPCPHANILVHLTTDQGTRTLGGVTDADGAYTIRVPVASRPDRPVDFTIEGYTADRQNVQIAGRRIATRDDDDFVVEQQLAFLTR